MKIGIAVPCHLRDVEIFRKYCLPSIQKLNPKPDELTVYFNEGHKDGLKGIKEKLYNNLCNDKNCDIILQCDADFYLFKNILKYVESNILVNYCNIVKTPISTIIRLVLRNIVKKPWAGCYALPCKIWNKQIKDNPIWDGSDSSVKYATNLNYKSIRVPKYMLVRRSIEAVRINALYHPLNVNKSIFSKMLKLAMTVEL